VLLANIEYRFSLPGFANRVSGAVYLDAGRVFDRGTESLDLGQIRVTPGIGFRYASPLGPVRLDIAFNPYAPQTSPLYVRQGNQLTVADPAYQPSVDLLGRFHIHFSIGQPF
jgi:outer membrane protein assembly factor BamA